MLQAGASKVNITPFVGGPMAGYSARDHGSEGVHDELYTKALVLDDGEVEVALITSDLIGIDRDLSGRVRGLVEEMVGLPADRVCVCASHTHFGPAVRRKRIEEEADDYDYAYIDVLAKKMATAVKLAHDRRRPARLGAGSAAADGISYNRRLLRDDGKVEMSLTLPPPYEGLEFGPVDPEVGVLKVEAEGDIIASVLNFACHPVSSTDRMYELSADYPGYAMDLIEKTEGGVCLFALGCAGNIVPIQRRGRSKRQVGLSLGGVALKALQWVGVAEEATIQAAWKEIELPLRDFPGPEEMERQIEEAKEAMEAAQKREASERELTELQQALRLAEAFPRWAERFEGASRLRTEIQAFRIGEIPIVGLPGEVFVELGQRIKEALGSSPTFVISLSNDSPSYIPIRQAYEEGGYESTVSPLAPGCGEHMVDEALGLIRSMK